jgi:hypothetical protein
MRTIGRKKDRVHDDTGIWSLDDRYEKSMWDRDGWPLPVLWELALGYRSFDHTHSGHPTTEAEMDDWYDTSNTNVTANSSGDYWPANGFNWANANTTGAGGTALGSNKPGFLPTDNYSFEAFGFYKPTETGTHYFYLDGDDAMDLFVAGNRMAWFYGGHGFAGVWANNAVGQFSNTDGIYLEKDRGYPFHVRMEELSGGDGIQIGIAKPSNTENIVLLDNDEWFYPDYLDDGEFGPRFKP